MPPLRATRSRSRLLVLAALLALLPAPGFAGQWPRLVGKGKLLSPHSLPESSRLRRAARTAVHFFNYQQGSPSTLRELGYVQRASVQIVPGVGRKYSLQFTTKDLLTGENLGTCKASVFYRNEKPKPAVEINCSPDEDFTEHLQEDYFLYQILRGDKQPPPQLLRGLGIYSSSLIAWELSTEDLTYILADIKDVKLRKEDGGAPECDYTVLLGESEGESSLSCHMHVTWIPRLPVEVKYDCSPEDGSSASADGSGGELGSTEEFFLTAENNF